MAPYLRPIRNYAIKAKGSIISTMYGIFGTARSVKEAREEYNRLEKRRDEIEQKLPEPRMTISNLDKDVRNRVIMLESNLAASLALNSDTLKSYSNFIDTVEKNTESEKRDLDSLEKFVKEKGRFD